MADLLWRLSQIRFYCQRGIMDDDMHFPYVGFEADQECDVEVDGCNFNL